MKCLIIFIETFSISHLQLFLCNVASFLQPCSGLSDTTLTYFLREHFLSLHVIFYFHSKFHRNKTMVQEANLCLSMHIQYILLPVSTGKWAQFRSLFIESFGEWPLENFILLGSSALYDAECKAYTDPFLQQVTCATGSWYVQHV